MRSSRTTSTKGRQKCLPLLFYQIFSKKSNQLLTKPQLCVIIHTESEAIEMEEILHSKFKVVLPNDGKLVLSSINRGVPFTTSDPNSILSREVQILAKKIYNENTLLSSNENEVSKKGFFSSFKAIFSKTCG